MLCSREAVLTVSPRTMPSPPSAARSTAAGPVSTPARTRSPGMPSSSPSERDRLGERERRADGALGVVLARDRRAPDGHHGVADELLDHPAVALDELAAALEVARQELADLLGVAVLGERREADEVGEQDETRRSSGRPARRRSLAAPGAGGRGARAPRHTTRRSGRRARWPPRSSGR